MKRVFGREICIHSVCITQEGQAVSTGQRSAVAVTCRAYAISSALSAASAPQKEG